MPEPADRRIRARNKKAILDAAIGIFREKGFDGTSIAEIAEAAGLPKANVYYYFKTKPAIYQTIIGDLIDEWDKALAHLTPDASRPTRLPPTSAPSSTSRAGIRRNRRCSPTRPLMAGAS